MTSTDRDILVKIYESQGRMMLRLDGLEAGQRVIVNRLDSVEAEQAAMKSEQKAMRDEIQAQREELNSQRSDIQGLTRAVIQLDKTQEGLSHDVGMMQNSINWGFAFMGLLIAVVSWLRPRDSKPEFSDDHIETVVRRVVRDMMPHVNS